MIGEWSRTRRIATLVLVLALAWDITAVIRLSQGDAAPVPAPTAIPSLAAITRRPLDDPQRFVQATARAPFGSEVSIVSAQVPPAFLPPVDQPRLTGTVVQGNSGFVVIELTDGSVRLVRLGEHTAGLTLRAVSPGMATFTDSTGRRIVLHSPTTETATRP